MLFRKKIEPSCSYCAYATELGEREAACLKKGVVSLSGACRRFRYDPLRRQPPEPQRLKTEGFTEADFTL